MKYPSITLLLPAICSLLCAPLHAVVLADFKCENSGHRIDCVITSDTVAVAKSLNLPVFLAKPAQPVSVTAFVDPESRVAASIGGNAQEKKALSDSVKRSLFDGAKLAGKPAWCSVKFTAESYFYVDPASNPGEDYTPPESTFRLDTQNLRTISLLAPATEVDKQPTMGFRFTIDEDGNTTSITALGTAGETVVKDMLLPRIAKLTFTPATLKGKPVAATLILSVNGIWAKPEGEKQQPAFMAEASVQPLPKLAKPYAGDAETTIKCFMTMDDKGMVNTVRLQGDLDIGLAVVIMKQLRTWGNPAHFDGDCKMPVAVVELKLTPGSPDFALVGEGRPIAFTPPKMETQGKFGKLGLVIDSFDNVRMNYTILASGKLGPITVVKESNNKFSIRLKAMIEESTYKPATIEGEPVDSQIDEICALKIMDYWINTDSLKW